MSYADIYRRMLRYDMHRRPPVHGSLCCVRRRLCKFFKVKHKDFSPPVFIFFARSPSLAKKKWVYCVSALDAATRTAVFMRQSLTLAAIKSAGQCLVKISLPQRKMCVLQSVPFAQSKVLPRRTSSIGRMWEQVWHTPRQVLTSNLWFNMKVSIGEVTRFP